MFLAPPFYSIQQVKSLWKSVAFLYQNSAPFRENFVCSSKNGSGKWGTPRIEWTVKLGVMPIPGAVQLPVPTVRGWIQPLKTHRTRSLLGKSPENFCPANWKKNRSMILFLLHIPKHLVKNAWGPLELAPGKIDLVGFLKLLREVFCEQQQQRKQLETLPADSLEETESWTFGTEYRSRVHVQNSTGVHHLPWVWLCRIFACKCGAQTLDGFKRFATSVNDMACKRDLFFLTGWFSYQRTTSAVSCFLFNSEKTLRIWIIFGMSSLQKKGNSLWLTIAV